MVDKNKILDIEKIKKCLPHKYPFLMIDKIIEQGMNYCKGLKNITFNEWFFSGHFPEQSVMPGMLIAECMAQSAAFIGMSEDYENYSGKVELDKKKKLKFLVSMNIKFTKSVVPGDQLIVEVKLVKKLGKFSIFQGKVTVENEVVASGEFTTVDIY